MNKHFILLISLCFVFTQTQSQTNNYFTSQEARDSITKALKNSVNETLQLPFIERYFPKYKGSYWAMQLMLYKPANYSKQLPFQIKQLPQTAAYFQYSFLEMLYTIYPKQYAKNVLSVWKELANAKVKALALEYLAQASIFPKIADTSVLAKTQHFNCYKKRWGKEKSIQLPTKANCLSKGFLPNQDVVISFQSTNRNKPGYVMFRTKNHTWLKNKKGGIAKYTQLARSVSDLPYYLTNGNTPQGLYKIIGTDTSDNAWIGQTTNLQIRLPFEEEPSSFFGADTNYKNSYMQLLGGLQKFYQLQESFIAGQLGRSEIIAHGTTINPAYYTSKTYYPCTPSLGCLCSPEVYSKNGELINSQQAEFMKQILQQKVNAKWLLVIEVSDL